MTVSIDGRGFRGEVRASSTGSVMLYNINGQFMHEFTVGSTLSVHTASGQEIARMSLVGTIRMVTAVGACSQQLAAQQQQPFGAPKEYAMPKAPFAPATQGGSSPGRSGTPESKVS